MINASKVNELFVDCLFSNDEIIDGKPIIEPLFVSGITVTVGFNPNRVERNKANITEIIRCLHDTFDEGWSFLNMCNDRTDNQWTGSHKTMEELMLLGLATGTLEYCASREIWNILPGCMPYIMRKL